MIIANEYGSCPVEQAPHQIEKLRVFPLSINFGKKTAMRLALHLLKQPKDDTHLLSESLKKLREDKIFRNAMIENGLLRAEETKPEVMVKKWRNLIENKAIPMYHHWCTISDSAKQNFFQRHYLNYLSSRLEQFSIQSTKKWHKLTRKK